MRRAAPRPLRILMILHMPWDRRMGGPRVSIETAEELRRQGHVVDKFDIDDALPPRGRIASFFDMAAFARKAREYVRAHGSEYDVIQAEIGNLPYSKADLRFDGLLVARSNGLFHHHQQLERDLRARARAEGRREGSLAGNALRWLAARTWGEREVNRSLRSADLVLLLNRDELRLVSGIVGGEDRCALVPNGLDEGRFAAFDEHARPARGRFQSQCVVFIGRWCRGKGSEDVPRIARRVREELPGVRFLLLGGGSDEGAIFDAFDPRDRGAVTVTSSYDPTNLPRLLVDATVGIFPSYMEGFPLGVIEKLAAGVPTVAYNVPGPPEMLEGLPGPLLVRAGDTAAAAAALKHLLTQDPAEYEALSDRCRAVAQDFRWSRIAEDMARLYTDRLAVGGAHG